MEPCDINAVNSEAYFICPTCKGKGYCEEAEFKKKTIPLQNGSCTPIIGPSRKTNSLTNASRIKDKLERKIPLLPNRMSPASSMNGLQEHYTNQLSKPGSRGNMSETSEILADLIGYEEIENPIEYAKIVKARLLSKEWDDRLQGMQGAVHLSRVDSNMAIEMGRVICRTILDEMNSLRSKCVRVACQAAKEIFKVGSGFVFRPVFDEIVNVLMGRAADSKRVIREDADDALMSIASYCPVQHVTRAFMKGPKHKHQLVRKSALRVLKALMNRIGTTALFKNNNFRDVRAPLLEAGCILLDDPIAEIRNMTKQVMAPLIIMPEFDIFIQNINTKYYQKVEKILNGLRYEMKK